MYQAAKGTPVYKRLNFRYFNSNHQLEKVMTVNGGKLSGPCWLFQDQAGVMSLEIRTMMIDEEMKFRKLFYYGQFIKDHWVVLTVPCSRIFVLSNDR